MFAVCINCVASLFVHQRLYLLVVSILVTLHAMTSFLVNKDCILENINYLLTECSLCYVYIIFNTVYWCGFKCVIPTVLYVTGTLVVSWMACQDWSKVSLIVYTCSLKIIESVYRHIYTVLAYSWLWSWVQCGQNTTAGTCASVTLPGMTSVTLLVWHYMSLIIGILYNLLVMYSQHACMCM